MCLNLDTGSTDKLHSSRNRCPLGYYTAGKGGGQGKEWKMKIRPILFNTAMVRAILDGRKTVTRRICKDANDFTVPDMEFYDAKKRTYVVHSYANKQHTDKISSAERTCPICPGDILYVRETWSTKQSNECIGSSTGRCPYDSCETASGVCFDDEYIYKADDSFNSSDRKWHPSIHMPKEAARIWIKVKDVRVERLQNMKLNDFLSEGVCIRPEAFNDPDNAYMQAKEEFIRIWDSTISKEQQNLYGWKADPWVWVIEFECCEKPAAAGKEG